MDELEEKINAVLNNPAELEKISKIASSIMGGNSNKPEEPPQEPDVDMGVDMGMLKQMLSGLRGNGGKKTESRDLLEAMKPFLAEKRRRKIDKAMKLARLASLAEIAVGGFGGEDHV